MKARLEKQRSGAVTFIEVLAIIVCLAFLAAIILPKLVAAKRVSGINCISNLKRVNLSLRIWEGDNNNEYPMLVSTNKGGGKEFIEAGDIADCFRAASNELSTTKILICPMDTSHTFATNFGNDFNNSHISYFLGADVTNDDNPAMILSGDDNFELHGIPVKSGLFNVTPGVLLGWSRDRHKYFCGNLGFADGSVSEVSTLQLQQALQQTGLATNRLAIP